MVISEGIPHLESISYIEDGGGGAKMKENDSKHFFLYLTHSFCCLQFYYLTIFQVELARLKLGHPDR